MENKDPSEFSFQVVSDANRDKAFVEAILNNRVIFEVGMEDGVNVEIFIIENNDMNPIPYANFVEALSEGKKILLDGFPLRE